MKHVFVLINTLLRFMRADACLLYTSQEVVDLLSDEYGWSDSVSNLSAKLQRESIRYKEVLELAAVLGYDLSLIHI